MATAGPALGEPLPVELMNTIWADRDGVHDTLDSVGGVHEWLVDSAERTPFSRPNIRELADGELEATAVSLRALRNALRRLAAEATVDPRPAEDSQISTVDDAVAVVNATAAATPRWPSLTWAGGTSLASTVHASAHDGLAVTSLIAEQAIALLAGEERGRLRACLAPGCVLYFVKSHPRREWCSGGCGNRARVARHYARHGQG